MASLEKNTYKPEWNRIWVRPGIICNKQEVVRRYDIKLPNGEVNHKIGLDNELVRLSPSRDGATCAWRTEGGCCEPIEVGTRIEMGNKILAKWTWKLYCTVIAVYEDHPLTSSTCLNALFDIYPDLDIQTLVLAGVPREDMVPGRVISQEKWPPVCHYKEAMGEDDNFMV